MAFRNAFNAGYIDPLLYARPDIRKWDSACVEMTNVITLPQGGFRRRDGSKYIATYSASLFTRMVGFKVGYSTQYLLVFRSDNASAHFLDIYSTDDALLTSIVSPYTAAAQAGMDLDGEADTVIIWHSALAPRRLLRAVLGSTPLRTTAASTVVAVTDADHGLLTGDQIGLSGLATVDDIPAAELNTSKSITAFSGDITDDSAVITAASNVVTVTTTAAHGLLTGDRVQIRDMETLGFGAITGASYTDVIGRDELNRIQTITFVSSTSFSFVVNTTVPTGQATSDGASGGGDVATWYAVDKYKISVTTPATAGTTGGGSSGIAWSLTSLAPNEARKVAITNVPQFNFKDASSPKPANEKQRLVFDTFATADRFRLSLEGDRGDKLDYASDGPTNAALFQDYLNSIKDKTGIRVEFDRTDGTEDHYIVTFDGDTSGKNWDPVSCQVTNSDNGLFSNESIADGGSTAEDVWSTTRGWPRTGVFHQRRLWMAASASRPLTVWASIPEDFFNYDTGDAQPSDAIDNTGQFDPIRYMRVGATGLHLITSGGLVDIQPDRDTGGFIHPLNFRAGENYGGAGVPPVVLSGLVHYVDVIERSIRQARFDDTDRLVAAEVSQLAQPLIREPDRLATLRNADGDYLFAVNSDGTMAVMNLDVPQEVLGWTFWETDGDYADACEVGGYLYTAVTRTNGLMIEKHSPDYFTDCGKIQTGSDLSSWSGLTHLNTETVAVRGDEATLDQKVVAAGVVASTAAGAAYPCDECEVGLPFSWSVQPTPVQLGLKTRLVRATVDFYQTRLDGDLKVGGYSLYSRPSSSLVNPPALVDGFKRVPLKGWGQRKTVAITGSGPQPAVIRGLELEAA